MRSCKLFFPPLAVGLLLSLVTGTSFAAGSPDGSAPSVTDNVTGAVPPAIDNATGAVPSAADNNWVDRTHSRIERDMFDTAVWFDRFFGGPPQGRPRASCRVS